jgi:hypothetical protein
MNVNLPQKVEQAYLAAARTKGVSVDTLVTEVLVSNAPVAEAPQHPELTEESGIPVLGVGQPLDPLTVTDTIDKIRLGRDLLALGRL